MNDNFQTWENLISFLHDTYKIEKNLHSVLFLIGIQETGKGFKKYSQDEKTSIIKHAQFSILSRENFYISVSKSKDHLPVWVQNPELSLPADKVLEKLLKSLILDYFNEKQFAN
jgi:murein L,D-transpeptidase YafK